MPFASSALFFMCALAWAADWPQWRGVERDGISPETGLLKSWPAGGPPLLWKVRDSVRATRHLPSRVAGCSRKASSGDEEFVLAIDTKTGSQALGDADRKILPRATRARSSRYAHRRWRSPLRDGRRWHAGLPGAEKRFKIWAVNCGAVPRADVPHWGISESPLVDGDRLIVTPGGKGASVVALDKMTGDALWQSQSDRAGYSSAGGLRSRGHRTSWWFSPGRPRWG